MSKRRQPPEFRKDLVSGDWILVAPERRKRPTFGKEKLKKESMASRKKRLAVCPFEDPQKSGNPFPILWYPWPGTPLKKRKDFSNWFVQVLANKYPLLWPPSGPKCPSIRASGPEQTLKGRGFHEVIITRDHFKTIDKMSIEEAECFLKAYQTRYQTLASEPCVNYILIFHNQGKLAGASLEHPHSQLVALPVVDPDIANSLAGSNDYYKRNRKCIHCDMLEWELKQNKRIIYKNKHFVTVSPFAPRVSYETRIYPLKHASHFEEISEEKRYALADSLTDALKRIAKALKNPDFNYFIHTAPPVANNQNKKNEHYHWHLEILPRVSAWAGLELGVGIEVVVASPEEAAENLRKAIRKKKHFL
jgi:UDPglucose--hexose-1-phosphate uridylyltransferase